MRASRGVPALLAALLLAGGCGWSGGEAADEEDGPLFPASGLSPEEPLLCEDGERDGEDCTAGGELRWSVPLDDDGAEYFVDLEASFEDKESVSLFSTRSRIRAPAVREQGKAADGTFFYAEDDRIRAVDLETGRQLWAVSLRENRVGETRGLHRLEGRLLVELGYGDLMGVPPEGELVVLDPESGEVVERTPLEDGDRVVGVAGSAVITERGGGTAGAYAGGERKWSAEPEEFPEDGERRASDRVALRDGGVYLVRTVRKYTGGDSSEEGAWADGGEWKEERTEVRPVDLESGEAGEALPPGSAEALRVVADDGERRPRGAVVYPAHQYGPDEGLQFMALPGHAWKEQALAYNGFGISRVGAFDGPGDGLEVGVGCAPDSVRPQPEPEAIGKALRWGNPRLFALNL
ncbi:outer membrane protein assembly factor BamB family protein [Nocardiopsis potens]|uniref:outer membrane protein assembly factor BamB family protein n=1 Tax=Nocardiopsis potens TaxID=1246458 RepID=UPI000348F438|nr:PQQ-binding-like beta-propeller repeat protein [Nocardiopsis potens]